MAKTKIAVVIEGQHFDSVKQAADYLNMNEGNLSYCLSHNKQRSLNGLSIAYADKDKEEATVAKCNSKKKKTHYIRNGKECPVYCETLNKKFKTITAAAKFAKAALWTMSVKMEKAGQFVDKEGNIYKRLKPMDTTRNYPNTTDHVLYNIQNKRVSVEKPVEVKPSLSGIELAKSLLKDKAVECLKGDNFDMATQLVDIIKQIKD